MKKILFVIAFVFIALGASAQESSEHLKFKGIPIDGPVSEFSSKLVEKGFTKIFNNDNMIVVVGDFAGYSGCMLLLTETKDTHEMYSVAVIPSFDKTWGELESKYNNLKRMLSTKYPKILISTENFKGHTPSSEIGKFYAVENGECDYKTMFAADGGNIVLGITNMKIGNETGCCVVLGYIDTINNAEKENSAIDDL